MRTLTKKLFVILSAAAMACSASFAHDHDASRSQELQPIFEQINQQYFSGQLKNVEVRWADLKSEEARGVTRFYDHGSFLIEVDRSTNAKSRDARIVLNHEACHVATHLKMEHESSEFHGAAFQNCMRRFATHRPIFTSLASFVVPAR
jgi:hypothetical protein